LHVIRRHPTITRHQRRRYRRRKSM
jgi:hypothetical protein